MTALNWICPLCAQTDESHVHSMFYIHEKLNDGWINKDRIRQRIKELESSKGYGDYQCDYACDDERVKVVEVLKELLGEEEKE